jgi:hypothetical protein
MPLHAEPATLLPKYKRLTNLWISEPFVFGMALKGIEPLIFSLRINSLTKRHNPL